MNGTVTVASSSAAAGESIARQHVRRREADANMVGTC